MYNSDEIEKECPVCKSTLTINISCDVSVDGVEHYKRRQDISDEPDYSQKPTDPYKPMLPNVGLFNEFLPAGQYKMKPYYCDGYIFFVGEPRFVFSVSDERDELAGKNYTDDVTKWKNNAVHEVEPVKANKSRVILAGEGDNLIHANRNHVDVFVALYANDPGNEYGYRLKFWAGSPEQVVIVTYADAIVGGFMPLKAFD